MLDNAMTTNREIKRKDKRAAKIKMNLWCWGFMSLTLIFYILFQGWPIVCSIYYSMLDWSGLTSNAAFIGLQNYKELMHDSMFWNAFRQSFQYTLMIVPLELAISLVLAYILNDKRLKGRGFYRTVYFVPVVTTASIVGIIMIFIWSVQGPVNSLLLTIGLISTPINFLGNGSFAMPTLILISIWKDCGIYMIYWLAGLQSVPEDVYEAATVDGAGRTRTFFSIVLPMIAPTAGIISILCIINSLKVFDIVKTMTEGGPFYATDVIGTFVYRVAFSSEMGLPRLGYASAAALAFGAVVIVIGLTLDCVKGILKKNRRKGDENMRKNKLKKMIGSAASHLFLLAVGFVWVYPFLWMVSASFKTPNEFFGSRLTLLPKEFTLENIIKVWEKANFDTYFLNTLVVTVCTVALVLLMTITAGYVMGRYDFVGKKLLTTIFVASIAIPLVSTIIPTYEIVKGMGLVGSKLGLILSGSGGAHVVFLLLFSGFYKQMPNELEEAARMDGCGFFRTFFSIMMPLGKPIAITVIIMESIWTWNAFLLPLVLTLNNPLSRTLAVGLYAFKGENTVDWTGIAAGGTIAVIPIIILFICLQKHFVEGVAGAVKS